jgi:selenide,water dikinase
MQSKPTARAAQRLVLVGGGHAHVTVLRALAMRPEPGLEITLIAKELDAPYSGMLPGYVAGHYDLDACLIDLVRLAHYAGARLIHGEADGLDAAAKRIHIAGRPPLAYDLLSINTGITPAIDGIAGAREHAIAVKPVSTFAPRWKALEARALQPDGPRRIVMAGTGAAGFELVLAIRHRLRQETVRRGLDPSGFRFTIVGSGPLLASHNRRARALAAQELADMGIELIENDAVVACRAGDVVLASGRIVPSEATLLTTKAAAPGWFADTGLALDTDGFLAVGETLQTIGHDDIFAAGDCAAVLAHPREKAGVFAVRQGPVLAQNLKLRVRGLLAVPFRPQRHFLTLLSCGDRRAIAARGALAAGGAWAWRLKDRIDRAFMRRFQDLPPPMGLAEGEEMLCAGCAAKLGPASLARALDRFVRGNGRDASLPSPPGAGLIRNLAPNDDAALLDLGADQLRLETIDQFPAIWPEPYVLGEIAAAHALGDVLAKGGRPDHVLALAGLPTAAAHLMEDDLFQMLSGAAAVLAPGGVSVVGGHTARTPEMSVGFFVSGTVPRDGAWLKGGLRGGEALVLTKPLGTGLVFAGWMRRLARARDVVAALAGMRMSSAAAADVLRTHRVTGVTDVTGFGLAGHLIEMLEASGLQATIGLGACPRYPGVDVLIAAGVRSSLLPDNLALADRIETDVDDAEAALALLFDPQTSGGLLAGVAADEAGRVLAELAAAGVEAAIVGRVHGRDEARPQGRCLRVRRELPPGSSTAAPASGDAAWAQ